MKRFLAKITALSRAQLTRLIRRWMDTRRIERKPARHPSFHRRYSDADIASLAEVDAAHEDLSGPAVRHLCQRAWLSIFAAVQQLGLKREPRKTPIHLVVIDHLEKTPTEN